MGVCRGLYSEWGQTRCFVVTARWWQPRLRCKWLAQCLEVPHHGMVVKSCRSLLVNLIPSCLAFPQTLSQHLWWLMFTKQLAPHSGQVTHDPKTVQVTSEYQEGEPKTAHSENALQSPGLPENCPSICTRVWRPWHPSNHNSTQNAQSLSLCSL